MLDVNFLAAIAAKGQIESGEETTSLPCLDLLLVKEVVFATLVTEEKPIFTGSSIAFLVARGRR